MLCNLRGGDCRYREGKYGKLIRRWCVATAAKYEQLPVRRSIKAAAMIKAANASKIEAADESTGKQTKKNEKELKRTEENERPSWHGVLTKKSARAICLAR